MFYVRAWRMLATERSYEAIGAPIPWRAIRDYAYFYGQDRTQAERIIYTIVEMDTEHCSILIEQEKKKKEK